MIANACQWAMILYAANPDVEIISPPVILVLGTITFVVGMVDIWIEIWLREIVGREAR
jgi:hypothetical protein